MALKKKIANSTRFQYLKISRVDFNREHSLFIFATLFERDSSDVEYSKEISQIHCEVPRTYEEEIREMIDGKEVLVDVEKKEVNDDFVISKLSCANSNIIKAAYNHIKASMDFLSDFENS